MVRYQPRDVMMESEMSRQKMVAQTLLVLQIRYATSRAHSTPRRWEGTARYAREKTCCLTWLGAREKKLSRSPYFCLDFPFVVCFVKLDTSRCFELRLREESCDALRVLMMRSLKVTEREEVICVAATEGRVRRCYVVGEL